MYIMALGNEAAESAEKRKAGILLAKQATFRPDDAWFRNKEV